MPDCYNSEARDDMGNGKWVAFTMDPCTRVKTVIEEGPAGPGMTDPNNIKRHWIAGQVSIGWEPDEDQMPKKLAPETLAKRRRSALRNKLAKTVPLFADQLEQLELEKRPDYYQGK